MKNNWKLEKLGDICEFINGKGHEKLIDEDGDYIVVNSKFVSSNGEVFKKSKSQLLPLLKNDIVLVMSDVPNGKTIAKCFKIEENNKYTLNQRVCSLRTNKIDIDFLFKQLNRNQYFLEFDNGENQTNLRKNDVLNCPILIPPLEEQRTIVAKLDQAFAAIDQAKANIEKNIANAKELFQSKLNQIFSQNGDGWDAKKLSFYFDIKHGYAFDGKSFEVSSDINLPIVLTPGNYNENGGLYFNEKNTKRAKENYPSDFLFKKGDLTVVMTDLSSKMKILGLPAIIENENILHNQRIGKFINKSNDKNFEVKFLYYFLMTKEYLDNIKITSTGTMVKHTAPKRILNNLLKYPISLETQQQIVTQLDQLQEQTNLLVTKYQQKLANLEELKKSILEKAFKGELV